jgi:tetratricopeptide (TPR) repeat protein
LDGAQEWQTSLVREVYEGRVGWTDALLRYADQARRQARPGEVVTALAALVEEYPWVSLFRYGLAASLEHAGRIPEAVGEYRRTLELRPGFTEAIVDMAFLLIEERQYDEAVSRLTPVAAPGETGTASAALRAKSLYGLAFVAISRDSAAAALALLDESLRLAPGYQAALELQSQIVRRAR